MNGEGSGCDGGDDDDVSLALDIFYDMRRPTRDASRGRRPAETRASGYVNGAGSNELPSPVRGQEVFLLVL